MSGRPNLIAIFFTLTFTVGTCQAQTALLLMRPGTADTGVCAAGTAEPKVIQFRNPKIKGQDEVRLAAELGSASMSTGIDENRFKRLKKSKIKDLSELESRDGLLYVATGEGRKLLAIPDIAVPKNSRTTLGQYAEMTLEGETQEGRKWTKQVFPLKSVWRVFVLSAAMTPDEALFRHAEQEKSIGQWAFYLTKVSSYRVKEANEGLSQATIGCLDSALQRFRGGDFRAVEDAKEFAQRLVAMAGQDTSVAQRLASIKKEEQDLRDRIRSGMQFRREQNWDQALAAWEPLVIYRNDPSMKDFGDAYGDVLAKSHDFHLDLAKKAEQTGASRGMTLEANSEAPFLEALKEYETALKRKPDSVSAQHGRRDMIIRIALIEVKRKRAAKQPGPAYELVAKTLKEQGNDDRLAAELKETGCEYGAQLYEQARNLVAAPVPVSVAKTASAKPVAAPKPTAPPKPGAPMPGVTAATKKTAVPAKPAATPAAPDVPPQVRVKVIQTPAEKPPFVEAREKLINAMGLCAAADKSQLLAQVNAALADFHVAQAKRSIQRKLFATALLHVKAAQSFQSDRSDLEPLLSQTREPVQKKAQFQAGVVVSSVVSECAPIAQQLVSSIESALSGAGANVQILAQDQAAQTLRRIRGAAAQSADTNYVIISGQLGVCSAAAAPQARQVRSKSATPNPRYPQIQEAERNASRNYDDCRRANPNNEAVCNQVRSNRDAIRQQLANEPSYHFQDYSYTERTITTSGQMRLTLQVDDNISRGTRPVGEATGVLNKSCLERSGVRPNDWGRVEQTSGGSGWSGLLRSLTTANRPGPAVEDVTCPAFERGASLQEMAEQVNQQAQSQSTAAIRAVSKGYLDLAKRATDQDLALENYIAFALLSADKSGADYQQALTAIRGRDADLKPETALQ